MLGDQHQLVRFSIKPRHVERITHSQRLMSSLCVRYSERPPLSLWAGWVIERILSCHSFVALLSLLHHHLPSDFFSLSKLHFLLILTGSVLALIISPT